MSYIKEKVKQVICGPLFSYLVQNTKTLLVRVPEGSKLSEYYEKYGFGLYSYLKTGPRYSYLATKSKDKPIIYVFDSKAERYDTNHGCDYYNYMRRASKQKDGTYIIPDLVEDPFTLENIPLVDKKFLNKQAGILKSNDKYKNIWTDYYEYDLNSAYAAIIYDKMPDTRYYRKYSFLNDNEIGFIFGDSLTLVEHGYADIIFPLVDTPEGLKKYLSRWYKRKQNKDKRYFGKHALVQAVGYLQYHNPYLRAYIVEKCNKNMTKLINDYKDDWILVNTDAIYLTKEIKDIKLGTEIGQFKLETGRIRTFNTADYELEDGTVKNRGKIQNLIFEKLENEDLWVLRKNQKENQQENQ